MTTPQPEANPLADQDLREQLPKDPDGWLGLLDVTADGLNESLILNGLAALDWQEATKLLDRLREITTRLAQIDALIVRHIYVTGEHGDTDIDGIGRVKVTRSRDRTKWDERGVAQAVIDKQMEARGGEMPNDPWEVAEWLLQVYGVNYCRVTPLRALGLEPDDYCDSTPGKPTVQLPRRD